MRVDGGIALAPDEVHLWMARDRWLQDDAVRARLIALLSEAELERHDRMRFPRGRNQQLLARALQREVLSRYATGIAPRDWRFDVNARGRPSPAPPFDAAGLHFNISHTDGLVVMAVGRVPGIGVDVEPAAERVPLEVARQYFSPREIAALDALPAGEQPRRFLRLWTLKEAYLKAVGEGLGFGLDTITFTLDEAAGIRFECDADRQAAHWRFLEFPLPGYLVALAWLGAPGRAPAVTLREYRPDLPSGEEQRAEP